MPFSLYIGPQPSGGEDKFCWYVQLNHVSICALTYDGFLKGGPTTCVCVKMTSPLALMVNGV